MADNYTTAYGAGGRTFAADEIADVLYPRVKLVIGGDGVNDGDASKANPIPIAQPGGSLTSISGSVTTGGTAQVLAASNANRKGLTLQNTSSSELRVSPWGTASATAGYKVAADALLVLDAPHCGVGAVSVWGATTGQTFVGGEAV